MSQITTNVTTKSPKTINIDFDNNIIIINGITNMVESDEKQIIANMGDRSIIITGTRMQVVSLDTTHNNCTISGCLYTFKYIKGTKKQSVIKKLFK